jgi:hypothetical protein
VRTEHFGHLVKLLLGATGAEVPRKLKLHGFTLLHDGS